MLYLHVKHTTNNILTFKFGNQVFKQHQASCVHQLLPALWLADYVIAALLLPSLHFFQPGTVAANSLASKKFREQVFLHTGYEVLSCTQVAVRNNEPSAQPKFPQKTPRVTAISKWVIIKIIKASRMDELDKNTKTGNWNSMYAYTYISEEGSIFGHILKQIPRSKKVKKKVWKSEKLKCDPGSIIYKSVPQSGD